MKRLPRTIFRIIIWSAVLGVMRPSLAVTLLLDYPIRDDMFFGCMPEQYVKTDTPIKLWVYRVPTHADDLAEFKLRC